MNKKTFFPDIPLPEGFAGSTSPLASHGAGHYVVYVDGMSREDYETYLNKVEAEGFIRYVDNGAGLANGAVRSAIYTKDALVLTVTHLTRMGRTTISVGFHQPLSEHLFYQEDYVAGNLKGAKTKLHMLEMWYFGNSFVLQLKNGHFIVSDGGCKCELPYLLDYLESLTRSGEKPVVEAWFITHAHPDHIGVMGAFLDDRRHTERLYVEGFYYNEPNEKVLGMNGSYSKKVMVDWMRVAASWMRTTKGEHPKVYRPQTGQRYYFNDVTMDILFAQEQLPEEKFSRDFNDSSTWYLFTIEGQKCLFTGDGDIGSMGMIMEIYDEKDMNFDVYTLQHHGFNCKNEFTDFCRVKTALLTVRKDLPVWKKEVDDYFLERVEEAFPWGDGTKVLTFPYQVGEVETLPGFEWIYNQGEERPMQPNIYSRPVKKKSVEKECGKK